MSQRHLLTIGRSFLCERIWSHFDGQLSHSIPLTINDHNYMTNWLNFFPIMQTTTEFEHLDQNPDCHEINEF